MRNYHPLIFRYNSINRRFFIW